ncbi:MAG: alpha/beta fold hydrolase, partial [Rhodospirillales bacterium]
RTFSSQDGLGLYFRDYGDPKSAATPVLCLPGVTRNSKDFADLAQRLAPERRVICPDYRGRGRSAYDPDWRRYIARNYVDDVRHLLVAAGVHRVHVIGTSLGGILAMAMAVATPTVLAGVVLNDIGPEVGQDGLAGIIAYMKDDTPLADWDAVVDHIRDAFPHLPARSPEDWLAIARNTYREAEDGRLVHDWDDAIVRQFERGLGARANLWPLFRALGRVPVLAVRGAFSTVLSAETFARMADEMPSIHQVTVDDCGHPTGLNEPHVLEAIDAHLRRA